MFKLTPKNTLRVLLKLCPTCHVDLVASEHNGIPVDLCLSCNGFWMNRETMEQLLHSIRTSAPSAHRREAAESET